LRYHLLLAALLVVLLACGYFSAASFSARPKLARHARRRRWAADLPTADAVHHPGHHLSLKDARQGVLSAIGCGRPLPPLSNQPPEEIAA
jgi:hypothetical protein